MSSATTTTTSSVSYRRRQLLLGIVNQFRDFSKNLSPKFAFIIRPLFCDTNFRNDIQPNTSRDMFKTLVVICAAIGSVGAVKCVVVVVVSFL